MAHLPQLLTTIAPTGNRAASVAPRYPPRGIPPAAAHGNALLPQCDRHGRAGSPGRATSWIVDMRRNACKAPRLQATHGESVPVCKIQIRLMGAAVRVSRRCAAASILLLVGLVAVTATASGTPAAGGGNGELAAIVGLVTAGQFRDASAGIGAALKQPGLPAATREALEFQRARMQRMREDFSLTAGEVEARVRKQIPDLTDAEFERWDAHGLFEHMYIDGKPMYFARSPSNLFHLSAEARAQSMTPMVFADSGLSKQF